MHGTVTSADSSAAINLTRHARLRAALPARNEMLSALLSAVLLAVVFLDMDLWWLAWIALTPLIYAIVQTDGARRAFILGWLWGAVFFYGSCYWLTYSMIRYGGIPAPVAYGLLVFPVLFMALFPALSIWALKRALLRFGLNTLFAAPLLWTAGELLRFHVTGILWNALGYSQSFKPEMISWARWGGVYLVSFLIVTVNALACYLWFNRQNAVRFGAALISLPLIFTVLFIAFGFEEFVISKSSYSSDPQATTNIIAIQPNVPMHFNKSVAELDELFARHFALAEGALAELTARYKAKYPDSQSQPSAVIIFPESPMNFSYSDDSQLRATLADFTRRHKVKLILNSLEPTADGGDYNAAIMIDEQGALTTQYDKIYLLPFGEYMPLPFGDKLPVMVGSFTRGEEYDLFNLGNNTRAGLSICFEAAFPDLSRQFALRGANVLINIANDGYLGATPVRRQHLANNIFRAVETGLPLVRVTNTGISAYIESDGTVRDATDTFTTATRIWEIKPSVSEPTFYTRHGDVFAWLCSIFSGLILIATFVKRRSSTLDF